jgi:hypothetical protein
MALGTLRRRAPDRHRGRSGLTRGRADTCEPCGKGRSGWAVVHSALMRSIWLSTATLCLSFGSPSMNSLTGSVPSDLR